jgi:hypothetical protein
MSPGPKIVSSRWAITLSQTDVGILRTSARGPGGRSVRSVLVINGQREMKIEPTDAVSCLQTLSQTAPALRAPARNNAEPQLDQINCRTSFREATDGRESDIIYVICVATLVLAAY